MSDVAAYCVFVCALFPGQVAKSHIKIMNISLLWAMWQYIMYLCVRCFQGRLLSHVLKLWIFHYYERCGSISCIYVCTVSQGRFLKSRIKIMNISLLWAMWQQIVYLCVRCFQCREVYLPALMVICCGMAAKRTGMLGVSVWKMKALTVKMETVTLDGKGRYNLTTICVFSVRN